MLRLAKFAAVPVLLLVAVAAFLLLRNDSDKANPEALIAATADAMAEASFSYRVTNCPLCPPPVVTEYAPPDRLMLSNSKGHDDWQYYLWTDGQGYFSSTGKRWLEGDGAQRLAFVLLSDPRFLLSVTTEASVQGSEKIDGRDASVLATNLDFDEYLQKLPAVLRFPELEAEFRRRFDGASIRFWIDNLDHRVLQLEFRPPNVDAGAIRFDYDTPVTLTDSVESMPMRRADELRREAERNVAPLIVAIRAYRDRAGLYPPSLDPAVLADLTPVPWPTNPFSGNPMRQEAEGAYEFEYQVKNDGRHMELRLWAWDSPYASFDSVRSGGELPPPRPQPPR
jgi:hypothetical protein